MSEVKVTTKICSKCKRKLKFKEFGNHSIGPKGLNSICKDCKRKQNKEYYEKKKKLQNKKSNDNIDEHE